MPVKKPPEKKGFDWNEFLRPTKEKYALFAIFIVCALVLGFLLIIFRDGTLILNPLSFFLILPLILGAFFSPMGMLFTTIISLITLFAYWYLISCLLVAVKEKSSKIALVILIILVLISLSPLLIPPRPSQISSRIAMAQCFAQIAKVPVCYTPQGEWNPNGCGQEGCNIADYYVDPACLRLNGALNGTAYYNDETHFNCGPRPA